MKCVRCGTTYVVRNASAPKHAAGECIDALVVMLTAERARSAALREERALRAEVERRNALAALELRIQLATQLAAERAKREEAERWCQHVNGVLADTERELEAERARSAALRAENERMREALVLIREPTGLPAAQAYAELRRIAMGALTQPASTEKKP